MRSPVAAACLLLASTVLPQLAHAGMGNRDATPKWHSEPCHGDACRADDPRSGLPCQGLLCSFSSSKALQPPVTAAQAAEALKPLETAAPSAKTAAVKTKRVKPVAKADGATDGTKATAKKPSTEPSSTTAN